jgi:carbon storage regulator CsrA
VTKGLACRRCGRVARKYAAGIARDGLCYVCRSRERAALGVGNPSRVGRGSWKPPPAEVHPERELLLRVLARLAAGGEPLTPSGWRADRPRAREGSAMLVLTRKEKQAVVLDVATSLGPAKIRVVVVEIGHGRVRLGVEAPKDMVAVTREELLGEGPGEAAP